jgi:hypothetical protein
MYYALSDFAKAKRPSHSIEQQAGSFPPPLRKRYPLENALPVATWYLGSQLISYPPAALFSRNSRPRRLENDAYPPRRWPFNRRKPLRVRNSRDIEETFTKQPTKTQLQTTMRTNRIAPLALLTATLSGCFTEANYHPYGGAQGKNPTAAGSFIDTNYAVPTYYGYPPRPYRVLGEMDTETHGRYRDALAAAANRASQYGADAKSWFWAMSIMGGCGGCSGR